MIFRTKTTQPETADIIGVVSGAGYRGSNPCLPAKLLHLRLGRLAARPVSREAPRLASLTASGSESLPPSAQDPQDRSFRRGHVFLALTRGARRAVANLANERTPASEQPPFALVEPAPRAAEHVKALYARPMANRATQEVAHIKRSEAPNKRARCRVRRLSRCSADVKVTVTVEPGRRCAARLDRAPAASVASCGRRRRS
jgi:hypothetical protein